MATAPPGTAATAEAFQLALSPQTLEHMADHVDADAWAFALEIGDTEVTFRSTDGIDNDLTLLAPRRLDLSESILELSVSLLEDVEQVIQVRPGRDYRAVQWLLSLGVPPRSARLANEPPLRGPIKHIQALLAGHPCPPSFGRSNEKEPWRGGKTLDWEVAYLARQPTIENRLAFYVSLHSDVMIGPPKDYRPESYDHSSRWTIPLAHGADGSRLLVVDSEPNSPKNASAPTIDLVEVIRIAAETKSGILLRNGLSPQDPAVEIPPGDIELVRRCSW